MIKNRRAFITGLKSASLTDKEKKFLKKFKPWGVIIFSRNIKSFDQLNKLINDIKKIFNDINYPILIDEEGGRVNRLKKLFDTSVFTGSFFGKTYKKDIKKFYLYYRIYSRQISYILKSFGININTAPVLDVRRKKSNNIIGDRSFDFDPKIVSKIGTFCIDEFTKNKIGTVIKHIPGHGLAKVDSHKKTPIVTEKISLLNKKDFYPFKRLNKESAAMVAHIIYNRIDNKLACYSKIIIEKIIRKKIGFTGLLFSDDINMKALKGSIKSRVKNILNSGCDIILHCNANLNEMVQIYKAIPLIKNKTLKKVSVIKRLV